MRQRRLLGVLIAAAAVISVVSACNSSKTTNSGQGTSGAGGYAMTQATSLPAAVQKIKDRGKLIWGVKFDQPLMGLRNPINGQIEGFDAEMGRLIALRIFGSDDPSHLQFVETISANREQYLNSGKIDMLAATYTINDARKKIVDFAGPHYVAGQDIMTKKNDTSINGLSDLAGKKVCVAVGSNSLTNLQKLNPKANVSAPLKTYSACAQAVRNGTYEAVSTDNVILLGYLNKSPDAFRVVGKPFTTEPYGIAFAHGSPELRSFVNEALDLERQNGDWVKAYKATIGVADPTVPTQPAVAPY